MDEIEFECLSCQHQLRAPSNLEGQLADCPFCGQSVEIPYLNSIPKAQQADNPPPQSVQESRSLKEYKVLTQKDKFFAGKFDPEKLEHAINAYASQGWQVVSVATASIPDILGSREEMVVVMVRNK